MHLTRSGPGAAALSGSGRGPQDREPGRGAGSRGRDSRYEASWPAALTCQTLRVSGSHGPRGGSRD